VNLTLLYQINAYQRTFKMLDEECTQPWSLVVDTPFYIN